MSRNYLGYRVLLGLMVGLCFVIGGALLRGFLVGTMMPGINESGTAALTNYWGFYMMGFAGTLLWAWGACLVSAVIAPATARAVGTATAFGLVVNAIFRLIAWFSGEYAEVGNLPRLEAAIMLLLVLGFIWLRPPRALEQANEQQQRGAA